MVNKLNNEVLKKVAEIINYLETTPNYKKYLLIKERMTNDQEINNLLEEIRVLQKLVANNKNDENLKQQLDIKNSLLNNIPLYRDYLNTLDDINNTFNIIENELNNYFTSIIN